MNRRQRTSLALFIAVAASQAALGADAGNYCRVVFGYALNPIGKVSSAVLGRFRPKKPRELNPDIYWERREVIARNPEIREKSLRSIGDESREIEVLFAHLDAQFAAIKTPVSAFRTVGRDPADSARFLATFQKIVDRNLEEAGSLEVREIRESSLDKLTLLFYGVSRSLPFEYVDPLLQTPNALYGGIFHLEMDRLILKHSLLEVLKTFGIVSGLKDPNFLERIRRDIFTALAIGGKATGLWDEASGITRLAYNPDFYGDVLRLGAGPAMEKWKPEFQRLLGNRVRIEIALTVAGAAFSGLATYSLAASYFEKKPLKPGELPKKVSQETEETPSEAMRKFLKDRWTDKRREEYGNDSIPEADRAYMYQYYDTLNVAHLQRTYEKVKSQMSETSH